jgi:hypothetical protein
MNRTLTLALAMIVVFVATIAILSQILPGPRKPADYLVMGGVATLVCLALLFVVLIAAPGRSK